MTNTGPMGPVAVLIAALLLCMSPLMRGGNRQIALLVLEAVGLLFFLSVWLRSSMSGQGPFRHSDEPLHRKLMLVLLASSPVWLALIYLVPLPSGFWSGLPGRGIYGPVMAASAIPIAASLPLSLVPDATRASLMAGIPLVAAFVAGYASRLPQLKILLGVVAGMAFLQILLGLLQAAGGGQSSLYFSVEFGSRPVGTFANTNHFANYIAMAVAAYVWLGWSATLLADDTVASGVRRIGKGHAVAFWIAGGAVLVLGIVMTLSRGAALSGLPAAVFAVGVAYISGGRPGNWRATLLVTIGVVLAAFALVGIGGVIARFDLGRISTDASFRNLLASSTMDGVREFWPWGAGWGTYASVYQRFQPITVNGRADYAHQDYAQMLFEGGIFAILIGAVFLWLAAGRVVQLARILLSKGSLEHGELASALCGVGLLGFLVHSLVEFNMHIPANAILAALLAGAFLRPVRAREVSE